MDDELLVALPRGHRLAARPRLRLIDLREETWVEAEQADCRRALDRACTAAGFEPRVRFGSEQWLGKQGLVAAGVGVALIPGLAIATVRDDIVLRSLSGAVPRRRVVAVRSASYRSPAIEPFVEVLREVTAEHCLECEQRTRAAA